MTAADIELAARENFSSVEHMKRYTTAGMSIDQGKTSNLSAMSLLAEQTGRTIAEVGTTTFRPMYSPVSMGALSAGINGDRYAPRRLMPAHGWHAAHGADFDDYGSWQRPACYPRPGEDRDAAIAREVRATRNAIGLFDGSPLGKIEVKGPDAAEFLNRIYVNNALSLAPGKARYGLMLNENGIIIDDGVFVCMAPGHYLVSTTSGGADRIAMWMDEWHQCEWPHLRMVIAPVTTQWAVLTLAGPRARELLKISRVSGKWTMYLWSLLHGHGTSSGRPRGAPHRVHAGHEVAVLPSTSNTARPMRVMRFMLTTTYGLSEISTPMCAMCEPMGPMRERHHVHRAAAHAALEEALERGAHLGRVDPVVGGAGVVLRFSSR